MIKESLNSTNSFKLTSVLLLLISVFSCDKYDIVRTNPFDPKSDYFMQLTTTDAKSVTSNSATTGGNVTLKEGVSVIARGVCWSTTQNPTINNNKTLDGTGAGGYTSYLTGLTANTTFYIRAYATNSAGTVYGNQVSFTTIYESCIPELISPANNEVLDNGCNNGGSDQASWIFNWNNCLGATKYNLYVKFPTAEPVIDTEITSSEYLYPDGGWIAEINRFGWTWKVRAFVNAEWGNWSKESVFNVERVNTDCPTVTDIDGNVYNMVTIGTQIWMKENLKTTKYNDETNISNITDNTAWSNLTSPAYCYYDNDAATQKNIYGALYNWYAVNTGKLCPTGWHVPSDVEWTTLTTYLGGESVAGGKLKETGTILWVSPNTGATNESGFTALPGGCRNDLGGCTYNGQYGYWWSSSEYDSFKGKWRLMGYDHADIIPHNNTKNYGFSIRCLRD